MNVHDSEKVSTLLEDAGLAAAGGEDDADVLVINTCSIRDKAEHQLYSDLGKLREWKAEKPGRIVGVGGCVAQQVGDRLLSRFNHLDFVFGTHNLRRVPAMLEGALGGRRAAWVGEDKSPERFDLPTRRPDLPTGVRRKAFSEELNEKKGESVIADLLYPRVGIYCRAQRAEVFRDPRSCR